MLLNFSKDWPVYFLIGISICFFIYAGYKGRQNEKQKKDQK